MDTIKYTFEILGDFIFNWTTYFWSIPIWILILSAMIKLGSSKIMLDDIPTMVLIGLFNPVFNILVIAGIAISPVVLAVFLLYKRIGKMKNKQIL